MASSVLEIWNKAVSLVGGTSIGSVDEESTNGRACRLHWSQLRDPILRDHPWNCATKRVVFARKTETPAYGFKYYFQLPVDALFVQEVEPEGFFEVEGRLILSDSQELMGKITWANNDTSKYDPQLAAAFSYLLASEICYLVTGSNSMRTELYNMGKELLSDAKASDSLEGRKPDKRGRRFLSAKYGR